MSTRVYCDACCAQIEKKEIEMIITEPSGEHLISESFDLCETCLNVIDVAMKKAITKRRKDRELPF